MHSRLVVLGRLLLFLAAAGAAIAAWGWAARTDPSGEAGGHYVCPMHPEVPSRSPGVCPICRMALEPAHPAPPEMPPNPSFDLVRQRSFGQDVVAPAWREGEGEIVASLYADELAVLSPDQ